MAKQKSLSRSGTSRRQGEIWLRAHRPDLLEVVQRGALTIHGAMVEAGARPKMVTIPIDIDSYRLLELRATASKQSVAEYCRTVLLGEKANADD